MSASDDSEERQLKDMEARAEAAERRAASAERLLAESRRQIEQLRGELKKTAQAVERENASAAEAEVAVARANALALELKKVESEAAKVRGLEDKVRDREDEIAAMSICMERVIHPAQDAVREASALRHVVNSLRDVLERSEDTQFWRERHELLASQTRARQKASSIATEGRESTIRELQRLLGHNQRLTEDRIASSDRQMGTMRDCYYGLADWLAVDSMDT